MKGAILFIFFLLVLGAAGYFVYMQLPGNPIALKINQTNENITLPQYSESKQFYPNLRFATNKITYGFEDACSDEKKVSVRDAVSILEKDTVLVFDEKPSNDAQVHILCSEIGPEPEQAGHFVAGEGGPTEIINTTLYSVIRGGKLSLYRDESCDRPLIALHEMLHVLGFDHNSNPQSIMYPTLNCNEQLDSHIVDSINALYHDESLPELTIIDANATKEGRYVSFSVKVMNRGLVEAESVSLDVLEGTNVLQTFDLGKIDIGVIKALSVENLKASRSGSEIKLHIRSPSRELDENNNYLTLSAA